MPESFKRSVTVKLEQPKCMWRKPWGLQAFSERTRSLPATGWHHGLAPQYRAPTSPAPSPSLPAAPAREGTAAHTVTPAVQGETCSCGWLLPSQVNAQPRPVWGQWHVRAARTLSVGQVTWFLRSQDPAATLNSALQAHTVEKSRTPSEGFPPSKAVVTGGYQRNRGHLQYLGSLTLWPWPHWTAFPSLVVIPGRDRHPTTGQALPVCASARKSDMSSWKCPMVVWENNKEKLTKKKKFSLLVGLSKAP